MALSPVQKDPLSQREISNCESKRLIDVYACEKNPLRSLNSASETANIQVKSYRPEVNENGKINRRIIYGVKTRIRVRFVFGKMCFKCNREEVIAPNDFFITKERNSIIFYHKLNLYSSRIFGKMCTLKF